jgi:hypothetical protein
MVANKKNPTKKNTKTETKKPKCNCANTLIQAGLAVYFTAYFIAHHFLGVYNVRWIFYVGLALMVLYAVKTKQKNEAKFAEGFCFNKVFLIYIIGCMIGTYYEEILTFCRTGNGFLGKVLSMARSTQSMAPVSSFLRFCSAVILNASGG